MPLHHLRSRFSKVPREERHSDDYLAMQNLTRELAFDPAGWTPERVDRIRQLFDGLAPEWHTRGGEERLRPIRDALERGGIPKGGVCVEVGSGTGLQTPPLSAHFDHVVSLDLAPKMIGLSARPDAVSLGRADATRLPLRTSSVDVVAAINMYLFPAEYARVLRPGGRLVFVSVLGDVTPIYLPPADVVGALEPAFGECHAVTALSGWGNWTVITKGVL
jgi:SAM-dependent methyltransferase